VPIRCRRSDLKLPWRVSGLLRPGTASALIPAPAGISRRSSSIASRDPPPSRGMTAR